MRKRLISCVVASTIAFTMVGAAHANNNVEATSVGIDSLSLIPNGWIHACSGGDPSECPPQRVARPEEDAEAAFDRLGFAWFSNFPQADSESIPSATHISTGEPTSTPFGWFDFCSRRPEECKVKKLPPQDVVLTGATWALLERTNKYANSAIAPISNLAHWGTLLDHWDYPADGKGDCKVYALYKRKLLMDAGLPRQALLITIVRDLEGQGHTILTVRTDQGDFILDNLVDEIRPWDATGYRYLKRQAQYDQNVWVDLGGVRGVTANEAAIF